MSLLAGSQSCVGRLRVSQKVRTRTVERHRSAEWLKSSVWVQCDESVQATVTSTVEPLPILYVDDYTVLEEVPKLTNLMRGDHCVVGLNPVRKLLPFLDSLLMELGSWEVLRCYHHFVVVDDVHSIDADGKPLRKDGAPAMICEYSNTPAGAVKSLFDRGFMDTLRDVAAFHKLELHDYTKASMNGVFRVTKTLTSEDRDRIVEDCQALTQDYAPYDFLFTNCESAAFCLSRSGKERGRFVSPQIPWALWSILRVIIAAIGSLALAQMPQRNDILSKECASFWSSEGMFLTSMETSRLPDDQLYQVSALWLHGVYHLLCTVPVALQTEIHLVRAAVHLTEQRKRLGNVAYYHLIAKEVSRAIFVGGIATFLVACMPQLVHNYGMVGEARATAALAYTVIGLVYGGLGQLFMRAMRMLGFGVPVPIFKRVRHQKEQ